MSVMSAGSLCNYFRLREEASFSEEQILKYAEAHPDLTSVKLDYTDCPDAVIVQVAKVCEQLEKIDIRGWGEIEFSHVEEVCALRPRLTELRLPGDLWLSRGELFKIVNSLPRLRRLSCMTDKVNLNDEDLLQFSRNCNDLTHVELGFVTGEVTDASVVQLARRCHSLVKLDLSDVAKISDDSLLAIAENCPKLTKLYLGSSLVKRGVWHGDERRLTLGDLVEKGAEGVTDEGVIALARRCLKLTALICPSSPGITAGGVHALSKYSKKLTRVAFLGCGNIPDEAIRRLVRRCPELEVLTLSCVRPTDPQLRDEIQRNYEDLRVDAQDSLIKEE